MIGLGCLPTFPLDSSILYQWSKRLGKGGIFSGEQHSATVLSIYSLESLKYPSADIVRHR
jgi:hypothetical protein